MGISNRNTFRNICVTSLLLYGPIILLWLFLVFFVLVVAVPSLGWTQLLDGKVMLVIGLVLIGTPLELLISFFLFQCAAKFPLRAFIAWATWNALIITTLFILDSIFGGVSMAVVDGGAKPDGAGKKLLNALETLPWLQPGIIVWLILGFYLLKRRRTR